MAVFNFSARDKEGKIIKGKVEAANLKEAVKILRGQNFFVTKLSPRLESPLIFLRRRLRRISFGDVVNFTRQLSTMFSAGLTLTDGLRILSAQFENPTLRQMTEEITHEVEGGKSFAEALAPHPVFPPTYLAVIRAGEASGQLDKVLAKLAENLEKQNALRAKLKGALVYPAIILVAMLIVVAVMMIVVMPKMIAMYKDFGADLPIVTRLLISFSEFSSRFWWVFLVAFVGVYFAYKSWRKTPFGRRRNDEIYLHLPILGNLKKQQVLAEFSRTLGLLVGAGVPLLQGLSIVSEATDNVLYQDSIREAGQQVEKGYPLSSVIGQNPLFPPLLAQMVKVGEETGKIDETMLRVSVYFEEASENAIKGLTTAVEPLIMIILGVGVGFLVIAVIMPIYSLTSSFQ